MAEAGADVALALETLELKNTCSHCGKKGATKRCSTCKQASYCGAECQNAAWKKHKKTCARPVSTIDVWEKVTAANAAGDWRGVLAWEGHLQELLEEHSDAPWKSGGILSAFIEAHTKAHNSGFSSSSTAHALALITLLERQIEVLGKLERFRDQGRFMCNLAGWLRLLKRRQEAAKQYERARAVGAAHGFFSVECSACLGFGRMAMDEGRHEEGVELLQNALVATRLGEDNNNAQELDVLSSLIPALFATDAIDELQPLVHHLREAAPEESQRSGRFSNAELQGFLCSARLHEVLCTPFPSWEPIHCAWLPHSAEADSVCHRFHTAREKSCSPFEPCNLCRHAGGLKRPRGRCALCSTSCARTRQPCTPNCLRVK